MRAACSSHQYAMTAQQQTTQEARAPWVTLLGEQGIQPISTAPLSVE